MKIMTFNTQHCLGYIEKKIDYDLMAKVIRESGADVIGLNEMRGQGISEGYDDQTGLLSRLSGIGYSYFAKAIDVRGKPDPYGNALLSRIPIVTAERILIPDPPREEKGYYETRCLLKASLENGFTVLVTHFGLVRAEQESAVQTVLQNLAPERCILMGDFNVTPEHPVLLPIRARMKDTADAFPSPRLSFPSDKPNRKIDYVFVSPDVEVLSADIPAIVASDHRPHTAEIA